ncbi:MAG: DUF1015 domain-containing protein [Dehalococcoidia bacterium]
MADIRPFRGLRYDAAEADPALTIAPPYDVISAEQQRALYERSAQNIVRVEYGEALATDAAADNRYTRAAAELASWRASGVLVRDERPALYVYRQGFEWGGERYVRTAAFAAVRLEPWDAGVIRPHERTLPKPKADRLELLRATRTQVSPVYALWRSRGAPFEAPAADAALYDFEADGQRHTLGAVYGERAQAAFAEGLRSSDVYIADGHHRYETALAYRDEMRARAGAWTGEEAENFVLMALTASDDAGLLVLPTHRIIDPPLMPEDALARIGRYLSAEEIAPDAAEASRRLAAAGGTAFVAVGLRPGAAYVLELRDRSGVEALIPADQPDAWRRLDVNVLQYGVLQEVFGIDKRAIAEGSVVTYTQDAPEAFAAVASGKAKLAFLLNATPVEQVLAVADAGGRMPQKSTYFYPKLPTGLVLRALEA